MSESRSGGIGPNQPARITHLPALVAALRTDPRFASSALDPLEDDLVELQRDGVRALLAMPGAWRSAEPLLARLASNQPSLLVCLGNVDELGAACSLRERAALFCLALPSSPELVAASLDTALDLAGRRNHASVAGDLARRYRYELSELIAIAAAISSERNLHRLLELILEKSRYITCADAGSIYVVVSHLDRPEARELRFEVAQNESIEVDFKAFTLPVSRRSIVGAAVVTREVINIPDLYALGNGNLLGIEHDRSFDQHTGYRTRSVLAVPLITQQDEVIGVLQLINKKLAPTDLLQKAADFDNRVIPFDDRSVELCKTLSTQAAISLENALLYQELREVFEGFVHASVTAIESRDPTTSGHSRRVADLTVNLAKIVDRVDAGPYQAVRFSADELREIEYAGLLHDFGKIGVPEPILLKADKLFPWEHELLVGRFDYLREHCRAEGLRQKLEALQRGGGPAQLAAIDAATSKQQEYLSYCLEVLEQANQPTVLDLEVTDFIKEISKKSYRDPAGHERSYLTPRELECLTVRRGSLTTEERHQIESHVVHTFRFLCTIPWGRALRRIPEIARDHHEKLDGTGYPLGKPGKEIPVQAKMMAISDIFDALTASDRPYKKAVPVERALSILADEVRTRKLDSDLFQLFVAAKVYELVI